VEQGYGNQPPRIAHDVASLSRETQQSLSEKANVAPPPPPPETRRKVPARRESTVSGQDFMGRSCSGNLHGPLLMEDPGAVAVEDPCPQRFNSLDFVYDNPEDFAPMRRAGWVLGEIDQATLHAAAQSTALAVLEAGEHRLEYFGVRDGLARVVQSSHTTPSEWQTGEHRQVRLPNGQIAFFSCSARPGELSILLPAASLDELAEWGRGLLAIA